MELCNSRIVRANELAELLGISRTTLWRWERQGRIPKKRRVGPNVTGWLASEIDAWWASQSPPEEENDAGGDG
jgi:prophage regulatory protein